MEQVCDIPIDIRYTKETHEICQPVEIAVMIFVMRVYELYAFLRHASYILKIDRPTQNKNINKMEVVTDIFFHYSNVYPSAMDYKKIHFG